jgi:hypothetical protein
MFRYRDDLRGLQREYDKLIDLQHRLLDPSVLLLTEDDFIFLKACGIKTTGMLLIDNDNPRRVR